MFNQLWSYHFFSNLRHKHKFGDEMEVRTMFYRFVRCADLRLYQGIRRYNNWTVQPFIGIIRGGTLRDAKQEGSTEGSTVWVPVPHEKNYINIHAWKNSYNNKNNTTCPEVSRFKYSNLQQYSSQKYRNNSPILSQ